MRSRRGHQIICVAGENTADQLALVGLPGDKGIFRERLFPDIKTKFGFAFLLVWPVTKETVVRKNGPDVAIIGNFIRRGCGHRGGSEPLKKEHRAYWPAKRQTSPSRF